MKVKDMLHEEYLKNGTRPVKTKTSEIKEHPELSGEKPPELITRKRKRGLGDVFVALQAQKVFNPNIPSIPSPQAAPANTFQKGVTPALDNSGSWGAAAEKGER